MDALIAMQLLVLFIGIVSRDVSATVFTLQNSCSYTVWPGSLNSSSATLGSSGFELGPGAMMQLPAPQGWSGRFWARTGCQFSESGAGTCTTGDCGGSIRCVGGGAPPVTLVEFTLNGASGLDFYDVSLVDGYNVGISVRPSGGTGDCRYTGCTNNVNANCPSELQMRDRSGQVVACRSACLAFNTAEYCCTGDHNRPATCPPTRYSNMFKALCPLAYSYAYDDQSSTFTCTGADYLITFCPSS